MIRLTRRGVLLVALAGLATVAALPGTRLALLRGAGTALVGSDPLSPADAIVISSSAGGAGVLTAADLFHARMASQVAVLADPPFPEDVELVRRGVPFESDAEQWRRWLKAMGVADVV